MRTLNHLELNNHSMVSSSVKLFYFNEDVFNSVVCK